MNVIEAMKVAKHESLGWYDDMHEAGPILAAEVERLRAELDETKRWLDERSDAYGKTCSVVDQLQAELAAVGDGDTWREACGRVEAELAKVRDELAAAKAASVLPVEIQSVYVNKYLGSVVVFIGNEKGAVEFDAWLCDRVRDTTLPTT